MKDKRQKTKEWEKRNQSDSVLKKSPRCQGNQHFPMRNLGFVSLIVCVTDDNLGALSLPLYSLPNQSIFRWARSAALQFQSTNAFYANPLFLPILSTQLQSKTTSFKHKCFIYLRKFICHPSLRFPLGQWVVTCMHIHVTVTYLGVTDMLVCKKKIWVVCKIVKKFFL